MGEVVDGQPLGVFFICRSFCQSIVPQPYLLWRLHGARNRRKRRDDREPICSPLGQRHWWVWQEMVFSYYYIMLQIIRHNTTKLGWFFQRKFETQVRKKEASCQTTSEDCYSIWRTAGIVPPHFDVRYNKVVYVFFFVLGITWTNVDRPTFE